MIQVMLQHVKNANFNANPYENLKACLNAQNHLNFIRRGKGGISKQHHR